MLALMSLVVSSTIWSLVGILTALGRGLNKSCPLEDDIVLVVSRPKKVHETVSTSLIITICMTLLNTTDVSTVSISQWAAALQQPHRVRWPKPVSNLSQFVRYKFSRIDKFTRILGVGCRKFYWWVYTWSTHFKLRSAKPHTIVSLQENNNKTHSKHSIG